MDNHNQRQRRRLFYCSRHAPEKPFLEWVPYDETKNRYLLHGALVDLEAAQQFLAGYVIPERRFWVGPENCHGMLPFNKARGRAFYGGTWQELSTLKLVHIIEAPVIEKLQAGSGELAFGAKPKGAFIKHARKRSNYK